VPWSGPSVVDSGRYRPHAGPGVRTPTPRILAAILLAAAVAACGGDGDVDVPGTGGHGVDLEVTACGASSGGVATARVRVTSQENAYDVVLITVDMVGPEGDVVGSGTGSVQDIRPGEPVEADVVLNAVGAPSDVTCRARVELAQQPA
jgi:hypothetical protein